jgi:hypothetical protein
VNEVRRHRELLVMKGRQRQRHEAVERAWSLGQE